MIDISFCEEFLRINIRRDGRGFSFVDLEGLRDIIGHKFVGFPFVEKLNICFSHIFSDFTELMIILT